MRRRPVWAARDNVFLLRPDRPTVNPEFARLASACRDPETTRLIAQHRQRLEAHRLAVGVES
jgi:hypothetical protein